MSKINSRNRIFFIKNILFSIIAFSCFTTSLQARFIHPGITHKKSDLDCMKYMVEAQINPWYSFYQEMASDSKSSFNYNVQGNSSFTVLARDVPRTNYNAWNNLQSIISNGTNALSAGIAYVMIEVTDIKPNKSIAVYPNPITATTTIKNAENSTIVIHDINGDVILKQKLSNNSEIIDLNGLATGMYYGEIIGENSKTVKKL